MGVIGGSLAHKFLTRICPNGETGYLSGAAYANTSKLATLAGEHLFDEIAGKTVIDFGCFTGTEAIEMAQRGAKRVFGIDIIEQYLEEARVHAARAGVADRCHFTTTPVERADIVVSLDSFEHFEDPAGILKVIDTYLAPGGKVVVSFGPPWYHPLGGHVFSVFPWAHLLFTERALVEWRRTWSPSDTGRRITDCGLNKITVARFKKIVAESPFEFERFETPPIRRLRFLSTAATREFTTAIVRCTLVRKRS
jgi:SAM-dependent methyltransferase